MSNIGNYNRMNTAENPLSYAKISSNTERVQAFVQQLHDFLPVITAEFDDLEDRQAKNPNEIFPIKMQALNDLYNAAQPLYEWYCEKAKRQA